jgi:hypothetical protein
MRFQGRSLIVTNSDAIPSADEVPHEHPGDSQLLKVNVGEKGLRLFRPRIAERRGVARTLSASQIGAAAAAGDAVHWATDPFTGRSTVVRWAPCLEEGGTTWPQPITYQVNTGGVPARIRLVQQALARLSAASGLQFRFRGKTSYIPHYAVLRSRAGPRYVFNAAQERAVTHVELVVAWATRAQSNLLAGAEAGVTSISWSGSTVSQLRIVQAGVVLRRGVPLEPGFAAGQSIGALLLHELGHAVGLQHSSSPSQIMYPIVGPWTRAAYHFGDLAGLRLVGRAAGCLGTPALAPPYPRAIASDSTSR